MTKKAMIVELMKANKFTWSPSLIKKTNDEKIKWLIRYYQKDIIESWYNRNFNKVD